MMRSQWHVKTTMTMPDHVGIIAGKNQVLLKEERTTQFPLANDPLKMVRKKHSENEFFGGLKKD